MTPRTIDLRSDTVTQPTDVMREAMARAEVGDDVLDEDPTLHRLQERASELLGKEAGLFVPSGTMANLVAVLTHCARGDEVILGDRSHIFLNEVGGMAALGGIQPRTVPNCDDGTLDLKAVAAAVRPNDVHYPISRLICMENTQNYCFGSAVKPEAMRAVRALADRHGLKLHLDGARLFNAATALDCPVRDLASDADSVMFCFSKGLSAPVGSVLCADRTFIQKARRIRKMVGGGMRQAGHLAAAGLVALDQQIPRLAEDHRLARRLAEGLGALPGIRLDPAQVQTNILFFQLDHPELAAERFLTGLRDRGILILILNQGKFRAVTHRHITEGDIDYVVAAARSLLNR